MPASSSNAGPTQIDATQFHPEFGYFAPTVRFRRKFVLIVEGLACGILVGAVAMFFATMDREEKVLAMLATPMPVTPVSSAATSSSPTASAASIPAATSPTPAASNRALPKPAAPTPASATSAPPQTAAGRGFAPVRFVSESLALPAATPTPAPVLGDLRPSFTVGVSASATEPAPLVAVAPASAPEAKVAKPRKKIVREPQPERTARQVAPEPEPRSAFATPIRPQAPAFLRPLFGLGF